MINRISNIYYKAFNSSLSCRGVKYKVGKTFHIDGPIIMCKNGFHCCENIKNCLKYYPEISRFCEVQVGEDYITEEDKTVTSKITIIKELNNKEICILLGIERYYKEEKLHSERDKPAIIQIDGTKKWYKEGNLHRERDKPAIIQIDGIKKWYKEGNLHRERDKPAVVWADGTKEWHKEGKIHREGDNPAIVWEDGTKEWHKEGKRHREGDQPAIVWEDGTKEWYKEGKIYTLTHMWDNRYL